MSVKLFRTLSAIILLGVFAIPANALRLDISADIDVKVQSYSKFIYGGRTYDTAFVSENAILGFDVSGIELENIPDSSFDAAIYLQGISGLTVDKMAEMPFAARPQESYPSENSMPYIRQAYVRTNRILSSKLSAVIGRQDYSLGQGIALGSDNMGFDGFLLRAENLLWGYGADLFYFNPSRYDIEISSSGSHAEISKYERKYHVYGAAIKNKTEEGEWQAYHFYQHYGDSSASSMGGNSVSETRSFTGIRYAMRKKHISFDGEAVMQGGSADLNGGGKADFSGYAFMLKGSWEQDIYIFDNVRLRLGYGRSSSSSYDEDGNFASDRDGAFYAALGSRYDGFNRSGYGAIAGASLYDMNASSGTASGLPDGFSGLSIVNAGADIPYKKIVLSADYYKFKADYINEVSRITFADEVDLKISWPIGKAFDMSLLYALFSPGEKAFGENVKKTSFAAFSVKARF